MKASATLVMAAKARELKQQGIDVISLSLGEPDFNVPDFIKVSAKKAIDDNHSQYTPVSGYLELREAICHKLKRDNQLEYSPNQIVVSTGAKQSLANIFLSILDENDEVIIPTPYWVTYAQQVEMCDGIPVFIETTIENDFKMTAEQLRNAITSKTKAIIYSSPCNPTGSVYSKEELQSFAQVLKENPHVLLISDEIYEHINFVGKHESIAQFDEIKNQVVIVHGASKGFAMTGWRLGFTASNIEIAKACEKIQGQITSGTSSIVQMASIDAFNADPSKISYMKEAYEKRKSLIINLLKEIKGLKINEPEGAFYIFPDVSNFIGKKDGDTIITSCGDLSLYLLDRAHVATVSGDAFGAPGHIRISYAASEENIIEAVKRIKKALESLD